MSITPTPPTAVTRQRRPSGRWSRRLRLVACALAVATVALGCTSADGDETTTGDEQEPAGATTQDETGTSDDEADTSEDDTVENGAEDDGAGDREVVETGGDLAPGSYVLDALGTTVLVDNETDLVVEFLAPASIVIGEGEASASGTSQIVGLFRPTGLASPDQLELDVFALLDDGGELPRFDGAFDVSAWAEGNDEILVEGSGSWTIGDLEVPYVDVRLDPDGSASVPGGCGPGPTDRCLQFSSSGVQQLPTVIVRTSEIYRIGVADQGEDEPVVVFAVADEDNAAWFDASVPSILAAVSLGEPEPLPADAAPPEAGFDEATGATELVESFQPIDENRYYSDSLGTRVTFDVEGEWEVQPNGNGYLVLTGPGSQGPNDRDVVFMRVSELSDPATGALDEPWSPDQIDEWLASPPAGLTITDVTETSFAGASATSFAVAVTLDAPCLDGDFFCVQFAGPGPDSHFFSTGFENRVIWVDQADEDPLAIVVGRPALDTTFDAVADQLLATVELGDVAPNPVGN